MNLIELRKSLNPLQKELLEEAAESYVTTQKGVLQRKLYRKFEFQKVRVNECLKSLGSIIYEVEDHNAVSHRIEPTFLGLLLSSRGEVYEQRIAAFLEYAEMLLRANDDQRAISSEEVKDALKLPKEDIFQLYLILQKGNLFGSSGHHPTERTWTAQIFKEVDDLPGWPSKRDFIEQRPYQSFCIIKLPFKANQFLEKTDHT